MHFSLLFRTKIVLLICFEQQLINGGYLLIRLGYSFQNIDVVYFIYDNKL